MRTFIASTALISNAAWTDALEAPHHVVQFPLLIVAATKKAAVEMLIAMGERAWSAESLVKSTSVTTRLSTDWDLIVVAGVIDPSEPGVYITEGAQRGSKVVRAISTDSALVLGRFDYETTPGGRGLFFVPA